ncbi:alpha/beta hydrolase [Jannaschia sp. S6380]|uniref:alpha/beta hydrolase n=1 Tax=Jannaschia sp. S6380 TaxID=2926408 RepID=UPI001FF5BF51|nr:alpha/beta hydrolase [Jannaschia sp. S6380]MCK0167927.1 alpha/beta hydrolase [Jannaschia sp. S6380]
MDRAALDDAYANAAYIPGADDYPASWQARARAFRAETRCQLDLAYARDAALDLFLPPGAARGLVVFVHGGYWHRFGKSDWSHLAAGALARGHAVAIPGYPLAPRVRIATITRRIAQAVDFAAACVPGPIRLTGHSAGGHLVARMLMADAAPASADRIAACVPISPVADLRPLVGQTMNADLRLDAAEARAESPALGQPRTDACVAVHVGADERPAFLWQARVLATAWNVPLYEAEGRHHFDVIEQLTDPVSPILGDLLGAPGS